MLSHSQLRGLQRGEWVKMTLITDTYTDEAMTKLFLIVDLYDSTTLTADITAQAVNARIWVNTILGREVDFTAAALAEVKNEGIVLAASQRVACSMELKRQESPSLVNEETKIDCAEALKTLVTWMKSNGITPPDEKTGIALATKITVVTAEKEYVI